MTLTDRVTLSGECHVNIADSCSRVSKSIAWARVIIFHPICRASKEFQFQNAPFARAGHSLLSALATPCAVHSTVGSGKIAIFF